MKKRILGIDGNYFGMRALGQINIGDKINNLQTEQEKNELRIALNIGVISLFEDWKPFIDNIIFTFDNSSWRKNVEPYKPYWITDNRPIGYKDNRAEKKDSSSINYDAFYEILNEFRADIASKFITFDIKGLEGDDALMLLSNKFKDNSEIEFIVFCTDGDLMQIVNPSCMLFRNIKSKDAPFGEFVMNLKMYSNILSHNDVPVEVKFLQNTMDNDFYKNLFQMKTQVPRKLNQGLTIAYPFKVALIKSICGDKKDNIFSILGWKSSTGTMEYKISEKIVEDALRNQGVEYLTEQVAISLFTTDGAMVKLIKQIISDKSKQIVMTLHYKAEDKPSKVEIAKKQKELCDDEEFFTNVMNHLKHNIRMNMLTVKNVPAVNIEQFDIAFKEYENAIIQRIDENIFNNFKINKIDAGTKVFADSLPDELKF